MAHGIADDTEHLGIRLKCPYCQANLIGFDCLSCWFRLQNISGILDALPPERAAHYARFIEEYERIRAAEGRGDESESFYLGLPYTDRSGRNRKQWEIRARSYDYLIAHVLKPNFPVEGGRILDLGAGNCWMSFRLAASGHHPVAVDLLTNGSDGLGAAEHYREHLPKLFPRFRAELAHLPFQNEQFDTIIFNASFHYAENYEVVLREALRCVKVGGMVVISDTPWYAREESGKQMIAERQAVFLHRYRTASDSIKSLEYLTDERLRTLEEQMSIRWTTYSPWYGFKWSMRPLVAKLRNRREPSRFRIYVARKELA
ncbi:bifunctional 2-polyprenyl-6-hydroxyphenol methylase/3-demethylubiquinol 3-O-methyltransferase UbiG [Granulicella sp. L56]|uniref:class I SAM-dependent methyltransferase n=1 Tax=Granulicella sp. L56 TaxID=1747222 RepID=UPI0020B15D93|nr:class I SAM-dependent methyltransferase [Granulicella sp. L56]